VLFPHSLGEKITGVVAATVVVMVVFDVANFIVILVLQNTTRHHCLPAFVMGARNQQLAKTLVAVSTERRINRV
jgi:hypothetical protein